MDYANMSPTVGAVRATHRSHWLWVFAVAAVLVVSFGTWWFVAHRTAQPASEGTPAQISKPVDNEAPQVALVDLQPEQTVSGTAAMHVSTSDNIGVVKVEYYVDDVFLGVTYNSPFAFSLDTTVLINGSHELVAKAYDAAGNQTSSQQIAFVVDNGVAASVAPATSSSTKKKATAATAATSSGSGSSEDSGGTTTPPAPPDTTSPSDPTGLVLSADGIFLADLDWNDSTDDVAVTGYKVFRDGSQIGTSSTSSYVDNGVVPGNTYHYKVQAYDAAANLSAFSAEPSITMPTTSIWTDADTPDATDSDTTPVELGVKFKPTVNGKVTGIKFYKGAGNTGTHTGNLWTSGGSNLASVTFSGETATGWQSATFSSPIDVTAGTTYVASYFAPNSHPSYSSHYFGTTGITTSYLTAPASAGADTNGVFYPNATSIFPTLSFNDTNYWVDVNFAPDPAAVGPTAIAANNAQVFSGYPGSNNTGVPAGRKLLARNRGFVHLRAGVTIKDIDLTDATIDADANNVTVQYVRLGFTGGGSWGIRQAGSMSGLQVKDTELHGDGVTSLTVGVLNSGGQITVQRANIRLVGDAVKGASTITLSDSFIHNLETFGGEFNNAFNVTGGSTIAITHNTILNQLNQTSAIGLYCDSGATSNVTVDGNLLAGGTYTVYVPDVVGNVACAGSSNISFTNNKFSRMFWSNGGSSGTTNVVATTVPSSTWTNNTWYEDGTAVSP